MSDVVEERTAALVSIGDELLDGAVEERNAAFLAGRLRGAGFALGLAVVVGDEEEAIAATLECAAARAHLVVATGGLGPTEDDRTRRALGRVLGEALVEDGEALDRLRRLFEGMGRPMPTSNRRQALRPRGAVFLPNSRGTAEGLWAERGETVFVLLPGVPHEMRAMWETAALPRVRERFGSGVPAPVRRVRAFGLSEADAGERLAELMAAGREPRVGLTVAAGVLTATVRGRNAGDRDAVERVAREVRERLGDAVFGDGDDTLEEVVVREARKRGVRLALAESCTGGLATRLIVRVPGASEVLVEGLCTYADVSKERRLGVPSSTLAAFGAVSRETAAAMAEGVARSSGAEFAVSTTGVAGPGGGSDEKPVGGVWFGVRGVGPGGVFVATRRRRFLGDREAVQEAAAYCALDLLRRALRGRLPEASGSAT